MYKKLFPFQIVGVILACLLLFFSTNHSSRASIQELLEPSTNPGNTWNAIVNAIEKIELAKTAGELSVDEAAILRLQAFLDVTALPEKFQPDVFIPITEALTVPSDLSGLSEVVSRLYIDEASWSEETQEAVRSQLDALQHVREINQAIYETEHFRIYWIDDPANNDHPPGGITYIEAFADSLELNWDLLENPSEFGYTMPNPTEYYLITDPPGTIYLDKFEVLVHQEPQVCGYIPLPDGVSAVTLPGTMMWGWLQNQNNFDDDAAHELFHLVQWDHYGSRIINCSNVLADFGYFYASSLTGGRGGWLMEGSSAWLEIEAYGESYDDQGSWFSQYNNNPDESLFAYQPLTAGYEVRHYGSFLFLEFLQEQFLGSYPPDGRTLIKSIWESIRNNQNAPVESVTNAMLNATSFPSEPEVWQSIFADFLVADYLKMIGNGGWNSNLEVNSEVPEVGIPIHVNKEGFGDPGGFVIEILPDDLGLPSGNDQTGATLSFELVTNCPYCAVDFLSIDANGLVSQSQTLITFDQNDTAEIEISDFGMPNGTSKLTAIFSSGAGGYGGWGYEPTGGIPSFGFFDYTIAAIDNPPKAPQNLTATTNNGSYPIQLSWNAIIETGIKYNVYMNDSFPFPLNATTRISTKQTGTTYTVNTGTPGTFYFIVTSVDRGLNESAISNLATVEIASTTPTPTPTSPGPSPTPTKTPTPTPTYPPFVNIWPDFGTPFPDPPTNPFTTLFGELAAPGNQLTSGGWDLPGASYGPGDHVYISGHYTCMDGNCLDEEEESGQVEIMVSGGNDFFFMEMNLKGPTLNCAQNTSGEVFFTCIAPPYQGGSQGVDAVWLQVSTSPSVSPIQAVYITDFSIDWFGAPPPPTATPTPPITPTPTPTKTPGCRPSTCPTPEAPLTPTP